MAAKRPQWVMDDKSYDGTFPAADVNRHDAMREALAVTRAYERSRDVTDFISDAISYHMTVAQHAYVDLAVMAETGSIAPFEGWAATPVANEKPGVTDFMLENPDQSGAYFVSIACSGEMTEEATAEFGEITRKIYQELENKGISKHQAVIRSLIKTDDMTPSELRMKDFERDPANYRDVASGDTLEGLSVIAINKKGPPPGVTSDDTSRLKDVIGSNDKDGYFCGRQIGARPARKYDEDGFLCEFGPSMNGGSSDVVMQIMSGLLAANGLAEKVAAENKILGKLSWKCFGSSPSALIKDVAHRSVYDSAGLFDAGVQEDIISFSRGIAAHDIGRNVEDYLKLARGLIEKDICDKDSSFDANDMRDQGHATSEDDVLSLHTETDNGTYRLDMGLDGSGDVNVLEAFCVSRAGKPTIGRFHLKDGIWCEDYAGDVVYGDEIEHSIRNIRDLNNMVSSLASLACVFEDEMTSDTPEP